MRIIAILFVLLLSSQADAQLFRRTTTTTRWVGTAHWGYPGDIASHLASTHGQSVAGLSREQMLDLHDALHEGRSIKMAPIQKPIKIPSDHAGGIVIVDRNGEYDPRLQPFKPIERTEAKPAEPVKAKEFWW